MIRLLLLSVLTLASIVVAVVASFFPAVVFGAFVDPGPLVDLVIAVSALVAFFALLVALAIWRPRLTPIVAAFGFLSLATACESMRGGDGSVAVGDVQALAVKACSFLPVAETVKAIIDVKSPALNTSAAVASAICEALAPKAGPGAGKATVAGVPIQGLVVR